MLFLFHVNITLLFKFIKRPLCSLLYLASFFELSVILILVEENNSVFCVLFAITGNDLVYIVC